MNKLIYYKLKKIASLLDIDIIVYDNNHLTSIRELLNNPIEKSNELKKRLILGGDSQDIPFIFKDEYHVYFSCIKLKEIYILIGPMSTEKLSHLDFSNFYRSYGISDKELKGLKKFSIHKILDAIGLLTSILLNQEYSDEDLLTANKLFVSDKIQNEKEKILLRIHEEEEELFHHTYNEERKLLDSVREGRIKDSLEHTRKLDMELGKLSTNEITHWKNAGIVGVTLCTRAAIEGGVSPSVAYQLSDFYIQKIDKCLDSNQVINFRNTAVEELTTKVFEKKQKVYISNYVERTKDYVNKNYREKIYLEDISEVIGVSSSYLSRLFKKETGMCFQDYVNEVKIEHAVNLLIYSNYELAKIASYVNFPSQSYFGKVFKEHKGIAPKKFRDLNKPDEFY